MTLTEKKEGLQLLDDVRFTESQHVARDPMVALVDIPIEIIGVAGVLIDVVTFVRDDSIFDETDSMDPVCAVVHFYDENEAVDGIRLVDGTRGTIDAALDLVELPVPFVFGQCLFGETGASQVQHHYHFFYRGGVCLGFVCVS